MHLALSRRLPILPLLAATLMLGACGGDSGPSDDVVGSYTADSWVLTTEGVAHDMLDEGGTITIRLAAGGTTTGTMNVPAEHAISGQLETWSLAGTYTFDPVSGRVTFAHVPITYMVHAEWTATGDRMTSSFLSGLGDGDGTVTVLERD